MTEGYDPEWLEFEAILGRRPCLTGDAENMAAMYNDVNAGLLPHWGPLSDAVKTYEEKCNEHVAVQIYAPVDQKGPLPVGVYYHGGGYISGYPALEDPICRIIAERTPCVLVSVDYRLAPAHKLPTGIDDGYDAFLWAYENASKLNGNPLAYFVIGGSAGGGIALSVTEKLIRNGKRSLVQGVVALNPVTTHMDNPPAKYKDIYKSYSEHATGAPLIDRHCMNVALGATAVQPDDSLVFVTLSPNLSSFPPVYLLTSEKDILRDDGIVLERVLRDAGVKVKRDHYATFPHYFFTFPSVKTAHTAILNVVQGIKFVLDLE